MKAIIVAYSDNRVIGNHGVIPWLGRIPADMQRVRELTTNQAIIMGRATFESIGRPLPKRQNIILTRGNFTAEGIDVCDNLENAFAKVEPGRDAYIFGGARVYAESLARASELGITTVFATEIHGEFSGDAFFPKLDFKIWREVERTNFSADEKNAIPYSFVQYEYVSRAKLVAVSEGVPII